MFDCITIGGATRDIFFEVPQIKKLKGDNLGEEKLLLPYGQKLCSADTFYSYGGGSINVAISLSRLGLKTAAVASIGKEGTGSLVVKKLVKEGVSIKYLKRSKHHTGLSVFLVGSDGDHTAILERGANDSLTFSPKDLKRTKWFYVSSLTGEAASNLKPLFATAKKYRIKVAFNPGSQQLAEGYGFLKDFIKQTEVLLLNLEEAEELVFSAQKAHPKTKKELISALAGLGAKTVVVTNSDKGSLAISGGEVFEQKAYSGTVIDTTGAGDAFGSTFVFGMIRSFDIETSLHLAALNAASVVSKMGAQDGLLTYNEIRK